MTDHYLDAVRFWQDGEKSRKLFAYECAMVDGLQTLALAQDCRVSVDTIEAHRNAWKLFYALDIESDTSRKLWDGLNISIWIAAARKVNSLPLDVLRDYLLDALDSGCTVEAFRVMLDNHTRTKPEWTTRLAKVAKLLHKMREDYKSEIPLPLRNMFEIALLDFENTLNAMNQIAQAEAE